MLFRSGLGLRLRLGLGVRLGLAVRLGLGLLEKLADTVTVRGSGCSERDRQRQTLRRCSVSVLYQIH